MKIILLIITLLLVGCSSKQPPQVKRLGKDPGEGQYVHKWGFENSPIGKISNSIANSITYFFADGKDIPVVKKTKHPLDDENIPIVEVKETKGDK